MTNLEEIHEIEHIKQDLKRGDLAIITEAVGCSYALVKSIFQGSRSFQSPHGKKIVTAAKVLIDNRDAINKGVINLIQKHL